MKFFNNVVVFSVVVFLVFAIIFTQINDSGDNSITGFAFHPFFSGYALPFSYVVGNAELFFSDASAIVSRSFGGGFFKKFSQFLFRNKKENSDAEKRGY